MDEQLLVDLWTLRLYRDQLVAEGASTEEWARYRVWRDRVMAAARIPIAA